MSLRGDLCYDSWSLSHLGYLYPGTTPVMIKLDQHTVLRCAVVCYRVLQCVAVCCSVLQCVVICCSVFQCVEVCCSVLQCVALCRNVF